MDIKYLDTFLKVCELKSFTLAAERLGLTQPGVSKQMQRLEAELNTGLFCREDHELALTEAGRHLYQTARLFVSEWSLLQNRLHQFDGPIQGTLRIGASSIPTKHFLPRILPAFHSDCPAVQVVVRSHDSGQVLDLLQKGEVDVALLGSKPESAEIASDRIATDRLVIVAHPAYCGNSEWHNCSFILREHGSGTRRAAEEALRDMGIFPEGISYTLQANDPSLIFRMVQSGLGLAIVSNLDAKDAVASGHVQIVRELTASRDFYVAYPRADQTTSLLQAFLRTVTLQMKQTLNSANS